MDTSSAALVGELGGCGVEARAQVRHLAPEGVYLPGGSERGEPAGVGETRAGVETREVTETMVIDERVLRRRGGVAAPGAGELSLQRRRARAPARRASGS